MNNLYQEFSQAALIGYEEKHLADKYEDYRMLVNEYRDGILLFQLMDEKVWSKAISDTSGLRKYFEQNRDKYKWAERAEAVIFNAKDSLTAVKVKNALSKDYYTGNEPELEGLNFALNSDSLDKENLTRLNKLIPYLISKNELVVKIAPHASSKESLEIAEKRAKRVRDYLLSKKVDTVKIVMAPAAIPSAKKVKDNEKDRKISFELMSLSPKSLEKTFNKNEPLALQVTEGLFAKGENEILDGVEWKADTTLLHKNGRYYLVLINNIEEPRLKRLDETRGIVISQYQDFLEKTWIDELREKYPVVINEEEVQKLVKKP
jgi:peptidyl-prolyl cis-trans isomerase SurA